VLSWCCRDNGASPPPMPATCDPALCSKCAPGGRWCNACIKGYGPGENGSCERCQLAQCTSCASDAWECWGCAIGYKLIGGSCVK
jgi:hypothetical protein